MTYVSPSSLSANTLPLYAQGEAVNVAPVRMRHAVVDDASGRRVVGREEAAVVQRVVDAPVEQRRRVVGAHIRVVPADVLVAALAVAERDVALRAGQHGVDRVVVVADVSRADVDHAVAGDWRRHVYVGQPAGEVPQQVARAVVGADLVLGGGDDLRTQVVLPDERRGPGARLVADHAPVLVAGRGVERRDVGRFGVVVHHEYLVVEQRRRRARAPAPFVRPVVDVARPGQVAVEVVGVEAEVAEQGVHPLAVGHGRCRGEGILGMDARPDRALVRRSPPQHRATVEVEAEHLPAVVARLHAVGDADAAVRYVQARTGRFVVVVGDHGGQENLAVPDDGTRPPQPGNGRLPRHVLGGAPGFRQLRIIGDHRRPVRPAELRPVVGRGRRHERPDQGNQQCYRPPSESRPFTHDNPPQFVRTSKL